MIPRTFHVKKRRELVSRETGSMADLEQQSASGLFSDAEFAEDYIEDILDIDPPRQAAQ